MEKAERNYGKEGAKGLLDEITEDDKELKDDTDVSDSEAEDNVEDDKFNPLSKHKQGAPKK